MPIKAVLFDLDDTLAPETSLTRTALTQAADAVRVQHLSPGDLAAGAQLAARQRWQDLRVRGAPRAVATWIDNVGIGSPELLWATFESGAPNPALAWLRAHRGVLRRVPWTEAAAALGVMLTVGTAARLAEQFVIARRALQKPAEGAADVLSTLRQRGLRTAIVTNGLPDLQRRKLALTGLGDLVDAVVISGDRGLGKPQAAGLEAVWLSTEARTEIHTQAHVGAQDYATITALPELLHLL